MYKIENFLSSNKFERKACGEEKYGSLTQIWEKGSIQVTVRPFVGFSVRVKGIVFYSELTSNQRMDTFINATTHCAKALKIAERLYKLKDPWEVCK